jgi:hypothetical protein
MDTDDSGALNATDAMRTLNYLFKDGPAPAGPYPAKGEDPTASDSLDCATPLP